MNCRYLQIGLFVDISNWFGDIFNWIGDISNSIEDIFNSFGDIFNSVNKCENGAPYMPSKDNKPVAFASKTLTSMARRFHIYSLNWRYLQLKCTYPQFNCRFETAQLHPRSTQRPGPRLASKAVDNPQPPSHGCRPVQLVHAEVGPQGLLCLWMWCPRADSGPHLGCLPTTPAAVWQRRNCQPGRGHESLARLYWSRDLRDIRKKNCRYLQIGLIVDIFKWIADISKWIVDIFKWIVDICNSIEDIYKSIEDIYKYFLFGDISNSIEDIFNSFGDIYNSFEDIFK